MNKPPEANKARTAEPSTPLKLAIDLGPLLLFFAANAAFGIYAATGVFMVATFIALGFAWWRYHKLPVMLLVTAAIVLVFGGLTLYLRDETFIKLKPTIVYLIFAGLLAGGLLMKKPVLELLFGSAFSLTEEGWRKLTWRWALFFVTMAIVNEAVRRNFSTDTWVSFKAFGFLPLTFLFAVAQVPLMQRYGLGEAEENPPTKDKSTSRRNQSRP
jgi:intracellular septation protein